MLENHLGRFEASGSKSREFAVYSKGRSSKNNTKTKALFYGIRCAFAHGSFEIKKESGEVWYTLENRYHGKLRGRYHLKEKTLLAWRDIVLAGPSTVQTKAGGKRAKNKSSK